MDDFRLDLPGQARREKNKGAPQPDIDPEAELEVEPPTETLPDESIQPAVDIDAEWEKNYRDLTEWDQQFSIRDMLLATTAVSIVFAFTRWVPLPLAAAILGFVVLFGLIASTVLPRPPRILYLGWCMALVLYVAFVILANILS